MALHIMKNRTTPPNLDNLYSHFATVEAHRNTGLKKFFGPKPGTAHLVRDCDPAQPTIRVVPPVWKNGESGEREILTECYRTTLITAALHLCDAVILPLLTVGDPGFPVWIDYKIAVNTVESFCRSYPTDVYLLAPPPAFRMPELRADVEAFLARNYFDTDLLWSSQPFSSQDDRFATIAPEPTESDYSMDDSAGYGECAADPFDITDSDYSMADSADYKECAPAPREIHDSFKPRKTPAMSRRGTGSVPFIPDLPDLDAGFSETLLSLIRKTGKKDSEIYNKANVSRQHFSKIRNNLNYKPTKSTAVAFAIALELDMEQTLDLIGRAGYTLTRSSRFDVIIMYFIQNRNYNLFDINETLYEFDQSLLGS